MDEIEVEEKEKDFCKKIYFCFQLLGAQSDLLSLIGSWKETLSDEDVLEGLDYWINEKVREYKEITNYVSKWHRT